MRFDYTTVGHVSADVMDDGSRRPGGSAFYSALQAARLGQRALILTRGVAQEIEELLEPYRGELELEVLAAPQTTTLQTTGSGSARSQRMLAWAGAIEEDIAVDTAILHLAPIARETPGRWRGSADFVGLTPQGLLRRWHRAGPGDRPARRPEERRIPRRCQALVLSEVERGDCAELISGAASRGAVVAITAGACATTLLLAGEGELAVPVPGVAAAIDDVGAGDVFAAAFFVALREGQAPRGAVDFANAAAALRIQRSGAQAIAGPPGDRGPAWCRGIGAASLSLVSPAADSISRESPAASSACCVTAGTRREQQAAGHRRHLHQRDQRARRALMHRGGYWLDQQRTGLEGTADQADWERR